MNVEESAQIVVPIACEGLLVSIGYSPKREARVDLAPLIARPENYAAGIVDFAGAELTGSITFLSDFQFFAAALPAAGRSRPTPGSTSDRLRVRDLAMELSNQLLGRIKNQLYRRGVVLEPTLPHAVSDDAIRVVVRGCKKAPHVYLAASHRVFIWFETTAKNTPTMRPETGLVAEGDFFEF
jgi:hypothetical protein